MRRREREKKYLEEQERDAKVAKFRFQGTETLKFERGATPSVDIGGEGVGMGAIVEDDERALGLVRDLLRLEEGPVVFEALNIINKI